MPRHRDLRGAKPLEDHGLARARELREPAGELEAHAVRSRDGEVGVGGAEETVADVAADDPGAGPQLGRGLRKEAADVLVRMWAYWLIRAHSTAPTCPARSPSRARRTRGRRAGFMNGDERRVARTVGATSFHERVMPPPMTNISGSMTLVRLIKANPMYRADRSTTILAWRSPRAAAANSSAAGWPVSFARLAPPQKTSRHPYWPQLSSGPLGATLMCPTSPAVPWPPPCNPPSMMRPPPTPVD